MRGLLAEYGIVIPEGIRNVRKQPPEILEDAENELSAIARQVFNQQYEELVEIDERVNLLTKLSDTHERCKQFKTVLGVGPMVSTAMGDQTHYQNGSEFAAFLGLVPRQFGTQRRLNYIVKRFDP